MASKSKVQNRSLAEFRRRCAVGIATLIAFISFTALTQPLIAQSAPNITGSWQGTVEAGRGFRIILQISQADRGQNGKIAWQGVFYTIGFGGTRESDVASLTLDRTALRFTIPPDGSFDGKLGVDGKSIAGTLKYGGGSYDISLERATATTAWPVPSATDHMPPDAAPEFEVATIKPADPNAHGQGFKSEGRRIFCDNESVNDIISFAYRVDKRQIVDGPAWLGEARYDVDGVPDLAGEPNMPQMQGMYRNLLASRFNLTFHHETRELSVYALRVGKNGPRLAKSLGDPKGSPDQTITNWTSQLIDLRETNATMTEFPMMLEFVLEKPVVDQTGLEGRFDFVLRWTPEGAPAADPNALPGLFTAIQEQLGLKLEATKAPVDVLVIDHIDNPSPN
jgi:uncharacterized protein (TIGR03435 family)